MWIARHILTLVTFVTRNSDKICRMFAVCFVVKCTIRVDAIFTDGIYHSGKSATIRESNHDSGVCKEHYS